MWLHGWRCKINPRATYSHYTEDLDEEKDPSVQQFYSLRNSFFMHQKYNTRQGIRNHKKLFEEAIELQPNEETKARFRKARREALKHAPRFWFDRLKYSSFSKPKWILFNDFAYEERREFHDTEDGQRIIVNS